MGTTVFNGVVRATGGFEAGTKATGVPVFGGGGELYQGGTSIASTAVELDSFILTGEIANISKQYIQLLIQP